MKNNIASERARLDMSQDQLGEVLSVSRDMVSRWETGRTPVPSTALVTMADMFGCTLDYLMRRCDERTSKYLIH